MDYSSQIRVNMTNYLCITVLNHCSCVTDSDDDTEQHIYIPFIPASDSGSRLQNEFEILKWLGKGGFGDVIKVSVGSVCSK